MPTPNANEKILVEKSGDLIKKFVTEFKGEMATILNATEGMKMVEVTTIVCASSITLLDQIFISLIKVLSTVHPDSVDFLKRQVEAGKAEINGRLNGLLIDLNSIPDRSYFDSNGKKQSYPSSDYQDEKPL